MEMQTRRLPKGFSVEIQPWNGWWRIIVRLEYSTLLMTTILTTGEFLIWSGLSSKYLHALSLSYFSLQTDPESFCLPGGFGGKVRTLQPGHIPRGSARLLWFLWLGPHFQTRHGWLCCQFRIFQVHICLANILFRLKNILYFSPRSVSLAKNVSYISMPNIRGHEEDDFLKMLEIKVSELEVKPDCVEL